MGAEQLERYLPLLEGKRIAIVANPTSSVYGTHLVDTLHQLGVRIEKIFSPEHGFRGEAEAGAEVTNGKDRKTGIPVQSLYGKHKKPTRAMLQDLDLILFDLQDVGTRFYTYISTMSYLLDACAEYGVKMVILDRPNPNGYYVDGPILQEEYASFVGLHPVPIVHGMTMGEYAQMVVGERWLQSEKSPHLTIIPCRGYTHKTRYVLPIRPSPNLPDMNSIYLYPSLCLFEGTVVSIGRGTPTPFSHYGHPAFPETGYHFTPVSTPGASLHPKHEGKRCNGYQLLKRAQTLRDTGRIDLTPLIKAWEQIGDSSFFTPFFEKLTGNKELRLQIMQGMREEEIRASWEKEQKVFCQKRAKYLLYEDY